MSENRFFHSGSCQSRARVPAAVHAAAVTGRPVDGNDRYAPLPVLRYYLDLG